MANWYGAARSNYVTITDIEALKADFDAKNLCIECVEKNGKYAFLPGNSEDGEFPSLLEDDSDWALEDSVLEFMPDDEVLVVMGSGAEKLRYITGYAYACMRGKPTVFLNLDNIYHKAEEAFGVDPTRAEY